MKIKANGIYMNYEIKGSGENLVLVHGGGDNLNMWYHQVSVFSKSYRIITYDVRGSGKTEISDVEYSMSLFVEDLYELMKAIRVENSYVLGYSMGGRIALRLAIAHPDMVKALILTNTPGVSPVLSEHAGRVGKTLEQLEKGDKNAMVEEMTTGAFSPGFKDKNPTEYEKYLKVKLQNKVEGLTRISQLAARESEPPDISKLKCPVLLIVGENDRVQRIEQAKQAQEMIANSKLVILPTGHASAIEAPEEFNSAVLNFLSGIRGE
jgi:3-oxoadipate enol-lactonase